MEAVPKGHTHVTYSYSSYHDSQTFKALTIDLWLIFPTSRDNPFSDKVENANLLDTATHV